MHASLINNQHIIKGGGGQPPATGVIRWMMHFTGPAITIILMLNGGL